MHIIQKHTLKMARCVTRDPSLYVCACVYIYILHIHTYMHIYVSLPFFRDLVLLLCFLRIYYVRYVFV